MSAEGSTVPNAKTSTEHWDSAWADEPRLRLPSPLHVGVGNLQRLLRRRVRPGMHVLEIGCAPGKLLAWVAKVLGASVTGLDYSARGMDVCSRLFRALGVQGDLRCEDVFESTLAPGTFDVVYSAGVIEHFDDPRDIVARHLAFLKPGGWAIITVPNYGGLYGRLQGYFDPANLAIHNLDIMTPAALERLVPPDAASVHAYPAGRLSPWIVSFARRWPSAIATVVNIALNAVGVLVPVETRVLAPMLVLEVQRAPGLPL